MGIADRRRTGATKLDGAETSGLPAQVNPGGFGDEDVASAALPLERIYANGEVRARIKDAARARTPTCTSRCARRGALLSELDVPIMVFDLIVVRFLLLSHLFGDPARVSRGAI